MADITTEGLVQILKSLSVTPDQLTAAAAALDEDTPTVTVADFEARWTQACPTRSLPTYRPHVRRLVEAHGTASLGAVSKGDLVVLMELVQQDVIAKKKAKGEKVNPDRDGKGAQENFVRAMRHFFNFAYDDNKISASPAERLKPDKRPKSLRRALDERELEELWAVAITGGNDPDLDALILDFCRETACRREGILNLTVGDIDVERRAVHLSEKNGDERDIPVSQRLMQRVLKHAVDRGARHDTDAVFRQRRGVPLTRRRFNSLFDRVQAALPWAARIGVSLHWIRHTTLKDGEIVGGLRKAQGYGGHSDETNGVTGTYTKVTWGLLQVRLTFQVWDVFPRKDGNCAQEVSSRVQA
jgi:site-specific recombinase XerD